MSYDAAIARAWRRVQERKVASLRCGPAPDTVARTELLGVMWLGPLLAEHGFSDADIEALGVVDLANADVSLVNVRRLWYSRQIDAEMALRAMHASGFANALALILELKGS